MTGTLSTWGDNSNGQLGVGTTAAHQLPTAVKDLADVASIEAGSGHAIAILANGSAFGWGRNAFGQLADGTTENQASPVPIRAPGELAAISPGGGHTLFLLRDGTVWASGAGFFGVLGPANRGVCPAPIPVPGLSGVVQIASGGGHNLALAQDGTVWSWGRDDYGQLGDGDDKSGKPGRDVREHAGRSYACRTVPCQVEGLSGVKLIAAGGGHSLAVLADGTLMTWGFNDCGQLGDGTATHRSAPVAIPGLHDVQAIAAAYHHTLVLQADGTVYSCGLNDQGQLGDGTTIHRSAPVQVAVLREVRALAASGGGSDLEPGNAGHSVALLADGTVWSWGNNDFGQLGDGGTTSRSTPEQIKDLSGVQAIAAGGEVPQFRENPGGGYCLAIQQGR